MLPGSSYSKSWCPYTTLLESAGQRAGQRAAQPEARQLVPRFLVPMHHLYRSGQRAGEPKARRVTPKILTSPMHYPPGVCNTLPLQVCRTSGL